MSLSDMYREEVGKMTIEKAKIERKKIQASINDGKFDTMMELAFQYTKVNILNEKIGTKSVIEPTHKTKKKKWRFWK
jgi:translation elongation factor P/translation initiation factor 5A